MSDPLEHITGIRAYLDASGVLENGTEEEIHAVRRQYRKLYLKRYKRNQREKKPEFAVQLSKTNGEHGKIQGAAQKHHMPVTAFLRLATLAYIDRTFLVPDRELVAKLAGVLEECLNQVRSMTGTKGKYNSFQLEEKYEAIEKRIAALTAEIERLFFFPPILEAAVTDAIRKDPALKERLLIILTNASCED